jgi:hypothetical protein
MPTLSDDQLAALRHHRAADYLGALDIIGSLAMGRVLAEQMSADGYRQYDDYISETVTVFKLTGADAPERVLYRTTFLDDVRARSLAALEVLGADASRPALHARSTLQLLTGGTRGAHAWLRATAQRARENLAEIDDADLAAYDQTKASARVAQRAVKAAHRDLTAERAARQDQRTESKAQAESDTRAVLAKWLPTLPPGTHPIGEVWSAFDRARTKDASALRAARPGALLVGRTTFYAILSDLGSVVNTGARRRSLVVPHTSTPAQEAPVTSEILAEASAYREAADQGERLLRMRELLAAGQPAAALLLQRESMAAVADIEAFRARREA